MVISMFSKKSKIIIVTIILAMLILTVFGFTYAYFVVRAKKTNTTTNVNLKFSDLKIEFSDNNSYIKAQDIVPSWSATKTFKVTNTGDADVMYDIVWLSLDNEFINDDMVYSISCATDCSGLNEKAVEEAGDNIPILTNIVIPATKTYTYTLKLTYKEKPVDQNYNNKMTLEGNIGILNTKDYVTKDRSIVRNGLELLYNKRSFSTATNTLLDKSGKHIDGTVFGNPTKNEEGMTFLNNGDNVIIGELNYNPVSVEAEFKINNIHNAYIVSNLNHGGYSLSINGAGRIYTEVVGVSDKYYQPYASNIGAGKYHAVGVFNGTDLKLYVNGELKTSMNVPENIKNPQSNGYLALGCKTFGKSCDTALHFVGTLSNIKVYSRALSAEEVKKNYNALN